MMEAKMIKQIYSFCYPEVKELIHNVVKHFPHELYDHSWKNQTENMHEDFLNAFKLWVSPSFPIPWQRFPNQYWSSGSMEAITHSIARLKQKKIYVFEGEYEGFSAQAASFRKDVVRLQRSNWLLALNQLAESGETNPVFYLSAPSSLDGNIWHDLDAFLKAFHNLFPEGKVRLDFAYFGTTTKTMPPITRWKAVDMLFFSFSKVFGVYHHRIGACFSRKPIPSLFGNKWFKNLLSIHIAGKLIENFGVNELPNIYADLQKMICHTAGVSPSDVVLIGHRIHNEKTLFTRYDFTERYCLTPLLDINSNI